MDYKKEIIEMIEKMSNLTFLKMAYGFVRRLYKEEKEQGVNPCFFYFMNRSIKSQNSFLSSGVS